MTKNNKKQLAESQQNPWILLAMGVISAVMIYVTGSWAIYSGSLWVYAFTAASAYSTLHFMHKFLRNRFLRSNKPKKAKTAKR